MRWNGSLLTFHNARGISLRICERRILGLHTKK